jgi:hypothetical protein
MHDKGVSTMFNTITEFFTDWHDACVYAAECGIGGMPGNELLGGFDLYGALATIAGVCYIVWWVNERGIARDAANRAKSARIDQSGDEICEELQPTDR